MQLKTFKSDGGKGKALEVADAIFSVEYNEGLVHQVVIAEMSAERSGTKAQKNRSAVRGGGAKPWRQKGTGRARAGTSRSPIWKGGGVTFAAQPRSFNQKVNRKMFSGALRSVFSELNRTDRLIVVDSFDIEAPKTKLLLDKLKGLDALNALIVTADWNENLYLASRNLYKVGLIDANWVVPLSLIAYEKVVITVDAIKAVEERLK